MKYFQYLPKFEYSKKTSVNIIVRGKIQELIKKRISYLYPYRVKDGERPDIISHKYYGNINYTFLVLYANNIYDVIHDWPLDTEAFNDYVREKYGSLEIAKQKLFAYYNKENLIIDQETYLATPEVERRVLYHYDMESILNERKRSIVLIDNEYSKTLMDEFKVLFR